MRAGAPYDWPTFWDDYDAGKWEPETKAVLERFLVPGSTFVDIGAWSGPVTLWAVELGAEVVALEPDPLAYAALCENCVDQRLVLPFPIALADHTGVTFLANEHLGDSQSRIAGEGVVVGCVSVSGLGRIVEHKPALVKLDVEGHETVVLPDLLKWRVPIYVSWHEPWWPAPVDDATRRSWFDSYTLEPIRGDGWTGFSELLAVPK